MDDRCACDLLSKLATISTSTGLVAVRSGIVTQDDMNKADEAARDLHPVTPVHFLSRECYVLSNGDRVRNPEGMQSSILESIWKFATINATVLREMIEKCDEIS